MSSLSKTTVISLKGTQKLYGKQLGKEEAKDIIYVGRPFTMGGWNLKGSPFANPYKTGKTCDIYPNGMPHDMVLLEYENYIRQKLKNDPILYDELKSMKGKRLACWCLDKNNTTHCHAVVLKNIIEEEDRIKLIIKINDLLIKPNVRTDTLYHILSILTKNTQIQ